MASVVPIPAEQTATVQLSPRQYWLATLVSVAVHALLLFALASPRFEEAQMAGGGGASFGLGGTDGAATQASTATDERQSQAEQAGSDNPNVEQDQPIGPTATEHALATPPPSESRKEKASATDVSEAHRAETPSAANETPANPAFAQAASRPVTSPAQNRTPLSGDDGAAAASSSSATSDVDRSLPTSAQSAAGSRRQEGAGSGSGLARDGSGDAARTNYTGLVTEHIRRNRRANAAGAGEAIVKIAIGTRGQVQQINIYRSSGAPDFDRQALQIARMAAPYPKPPLGQGPVLVRIKGS